MIRFILAAAGLFVLMPTGVFAQGFGESATVPAEAAVSKSSASTNAVPGGFALYYGSTHIRPGARLTLRDMTDDSSGVSTEFRPLFTVGARVEVYSDGLLGIVLDGSTTRVDSPVTTTNGSAVLRRTINYMDSALSFLAVVRGKWTPVKPYAGLGPSLLFTHFDGEGGIKLAAGMLFVAGTQLWVSRRAYGFAEARYNLLADRHYFFDSFGVQDAPFPTMMVTVSGSNWSIVFGGGFGW